MGPLLTKKDFLSILIIKKIYIIPQLKLDKKYNNFFVVSKYQTVRENKMGTYFENRQKAIPATDEEMERLFKCVADYFSHTWLKSKAGHHPLQQLWNRKDALSTNELYFFSSCFEKLAAVDPKWLKKQVTLIKSDQVNNRLGAFFEIIGLGMFLFSDYNVKPTKGDNPGFDGIFCIPPLKTMRLSLKNYGDSSHFKEVTSKAKKVEEHLVKIIRELGIINIQLIISCDAYPSDKNWKDLLDQLKQVIAMHISGFPQIGLIGNFWQIMMGDLEKKDYNFNTERNSYTILMSCPFHANEEKNLLDKLEDACHNLIKHTKTEDENTLNAVFIHLPENASIHECKIWTEKYFSDNPERPITCVIMYQPTVVTDIDANTNSIHNCFQFVIKNERMLQWNSLGTPISLVLPVGKVDLIPAKNQLVMERDGKRETLDFDGRYLYQRGHYYLLAKKKKDGSIFGVMPKLASGIFVHTFFQPFPGQAGIELSGQHAPVDKLLIL